MYNANMVIRKFLRIVLPLSLIVAGIWLLQQPGTLQSEGQTRQRALIQALAPANNAALAEPASGTTRQSFVHDPVEPRTVDFREIIPKTDVTDTMEYKWLNGEIDLERESTILAESEMNRLRQLSLRMAPQEDVQQTTGTPGPAAPVQGIGFDSISFNEESGGAVPPDPELAVGPNHLVAAVNIAIGIYDKDGDTVFGPLHAHNLFSQSQCEDGLFDPNVLYDEEADRWIIAFDVGDFDSNGGYCLLASQSGNPAGAWYEYFFQLNDNSVWLDFPQAGVGDSYIFVGGNMFTQQGIFSEGRVFAFDKNDLYNGNAVAALEHGLGAGHSTPQPVNLHGYSTGTWPAYGDDHYFLTDPFNGQTYRLVRWNPVSESSTVIGLIDLGNAGMPVPVPQNGPGALEANDYRPLDFEYRNGHGWTTMTVACNPGAGTVNCVRWAQIRLSDATLGPAGAGLYGSDGEYRFYPDVAVNHCNDMMVGYSKSASSIYPAAWVSGRESGDRFGTLQAESELKAGEISYQSVEGDISPYRWGDYTGMTIDPDGRTFWYMGQYSRNHTPTAKWGTYIGSYTFAGCTGGSAPLSHDHYLPLLSTAGQLTPGTPIVNGGFEEGPSRGWQPRSTQGYALIVREANMPSYLTAHSGSWVAWLGGANNEISDLSQSIIVPTSDPTLRFWYWIDSSDDCGYDFGGVLVNGSTAVDILNLCKDQNTEGWEQRTVNLSSYAGQQIVISFRAETDGTLSSNFFVDDVSFGAAESLARPSTEARFPTEARDKDASGVPRLPGSARLTERVWPVTGSSK